MENTPNILSTLGYEQIEDKDGYVSLSVEDIMRLETKMADLQTGAKDLAERSAAHEAEAQKAAQDLQATIDQLNQQLEESRKAQADQQATIDEQQRTMEAYRKATPPTIDNKPADEPKSQEPDLDSLRRLYDALNS